MLSIIKKHIFTDGEEFKVHLISVDEDMKEYYLQLSEQYKFLEDTDDTMLFLIRSKGYDQEVLVDQSEIERCITIVQRELEVYEMFEECAILQKVKEEFNNHDNKL